MKIIYHDPDKTVRKLVARPGDWLVSYPNDPAVKSVGPTVARRPRTTKTKKGKKIIEAIETLSPIKALKRGPGTVF